MSELYQKVEQFVRDSYIRVGKEIHIEHALRTVHWVKQFKPDADEGLLIAALGHDIEKAYRKPDMDKKRVSSGYTTDDFLRLHQERGAEIIKDYLLREGADTGLADRVYMLISHHETGGNEEQNLLRDADSVSFFEVYPSRMLKKVSEVGKDKVKEKLDWMFDRIGSERAQDEARSLYEKSITDLAAR